MRRGRACEGSLCTQKPLQFLKSISFLPHIFILFFFIFGLPLFSVFLLARLSQSQVLCRVLGAVLCKARLVFVSTNHHIPCRSGQIFLSLRFSPITVPLSPFFLWKWIQHAFKAAFFTFRDAQFRRTLWQHQFSILFIFSPKKKALLMSVLFVSLDPCWRHYMYSGSKPLPFIITSSVIVV